jgi:chemotaxis protein MotB
MINRQAVAIALCAPLLSLACVSKGTYEEQVQAANDVRTQLTKCKAASRDLAVGRTSMQKELDDATAVDEQLSAELKRLGENSQAVLATNGSLKAALDSSRKRLDELRRAQAAAEARAALYRDLALKLKGMVDAGDLAITLREGRMVLRLPNDVLFDSGKAVLKAAGERALSDIAAVLKTIPERRLQVAGHTDDEPIRFSSFHSNWELSTARALSVVNLLVSKGVDGHALSAAGFGEFDPVEANDTAAGKARNRRTEITVQPNIDEIVAVPEEQ